MDHLIDAFANNPTTANIVEQCKWSQSMSFPILCEDSPDVVAQIRDRLETTIEQVLSGGLKCSVNGQELDHPSQLQFREEIKRLADIMCAPG